MAKPTPSADQITAINQQVTLNTSQKNAVDQSVPLQDIDIDRLQKVDDAFKVLFTWYNDAVIGKYDAERKAINGPFVVSPVVEVDLTNVAANPPTGRLAPTPPTQDIVRIAEFDGGAYTGSTNLNEQQHIIEQASMENVLVNGYGPGSFPGTLTTFTAITPSSTTLTLEDSAVAISSVAPNTVFIVSDLGDFAVVKCLTITPDNPPTPPPYKSNLTIELLVAPSGTIAAGATLDSFTGFSNAERSTKTASNPDMQPLMNYLVSSLQTILNNRKTRQTEQVTALSGNEDADGATQITTATTAANNSTSFINSYLVSTDISDTGLASLASERSTRTTFLTTRLSQILANYTGQTEDYYEQRYQAANNRGNTSRGTLRSLSNAQNNKLTLQNMSTGLATANSVLNGILP